MPVRNVVRYKATSTYYHVYNRGHNRSALFLDDSDYLFFTSLLKRVFGKEQLKDRKGHVYPWFGDKVELVAYCLMPNHFHLLVFQLGDVKGLSKAMQSLGITYSMYFNHKYNHRGSAYESAFKASPILDEPYLLHITRYIHLNPKDYSSWPYSSYSDYIDGNKKSWVKSKSILDLFASVQEYIEFVDDYKALKDELDTLKYELADYAETY